MQLLASRKVEAIELKEACEFDRRRSCEDLKADLLSKC